MSASRHFPPPGLRSVLIDLDGTLVDSARMVTMALGALCTERGVSAPSVHAVRGWISLGADALVKAALGDAATEPAHDVARMRALLASTPAERQAIYPGVRAAMETLRDQGLVLAVVTNKPRSLSIQLLNDLELAGYFAVVVGGDTTACAKPHPAPLLAALAAIAGTVETSVFVGDSIVDAEAAAALSIPFCLYTAGYGAADCPARLIGERFGDYAALPALLTRPPA